MLPRALASLGILGLCASASLGQITLQFNTNTIQVAHSDSVTCQGLRDVLAGIDDSDSTNRYLVRLEPGEFTCGSLPLILPEGVTLEGAGQELSLITGTSDSDFGVVHLLDSTTLRSLTVDNTLGAGTIGGHAVSIFSLVNMVTDVLLDKVSVSGATNGDNNEAILASNASFRAQFSLLGLFDLSNANASCSYSRWGSVIGSTFTESCQFCFGALGQPLDTGCN